jgi:hypothetical protein
MVEAQFGSKLRTNRLYAIKKEVDLQKMGITGAREVLPKEQQ